MISRGWMNAQNRRSHYCKDTIEPGVIYDYQFSMVPMDHTVRAGRRLCLVLYGTDVEATQRPFAVTELSLEQDSVRVAVPMAPVAAHVEVRAPPFFQKITCRSTGALGGGVALVIVTGIERRDHTLIFLISIQFPLMSAGNFQDQLVNIHRNAIGELWQVPFTGKDQQESVLVQRNRIFRRTQVHGRILICTNFRLI